jgi:hypothetical protein
MGGSLSQAELPQSSQSDVILSLSFDLGVAANLGKRTLARIKKEEFRILKLERHADTVAAVPL